MSFIPKVILVTGGAGFIGSRFILHALQHWPEAHVINLDKLTYAANLSYLEAVAHTPRYQFVEGDINDAALIKNLLHHSHVNCIVHCAAESHVDRSISGPAAFIETNIVGTFTLLETARQIWLEYNKWDQTHCRFHHISTDEVFGSLSATDPRFNETTAYQPNSPYSASKASSDHLVRAYFHTYGLPITLSNCSNNYGPHQHDEKLIPTVIRTALANKPIPVYGDGSNIRDWLYVDDHCHALSTIVEYGSIGESYAIGGDCELDNLKLINTLCSLLDKHVPKATPYSELVTFIDDRPGHDWRYAIEHKKLTQQLGWQPQTLLEFGLHQTITHLLARYTPS